MKKRKGTDTMLCTPTHKDELRWAVERVAETAIRADKGIQQKRDAIMDAVMKATTTVLKSGGRKIAG